MSSVFAWGIGLWIVASIACMTLAQLRDVRWPTGLALGSWLFISCVDLAFQLIKWQDHHHYGQSTSDTLRFISAMLFIAAIVALAVALISALPARDEEVPEKAPVVMDDGGPFDDITWSGFQPAPVIVRD